MFHFWEITKDSKETPLSQHVHPWNAVLDVVCFVMCSCPLMLQVTTNARTYMGHLQLFPSFALVRKVSWLYPCHTLQEEVHLTGKHTCCKGNESILFGWFLYHPLHILCVSVHATSPCLFPIQLGTCITHKETPQLDPWARRETSQTSLSIIQSTHSTRGYTQMNHPVPPKRPPRSPSVSASEC